MSARPSRLMLGTGTAMLALALTGGPFLLGAAPAGAAQNDITICHATGAHTNPYVTHTPAKTADAGGHDGHKGGVWFAGITVEWGDIIPPFDYDGGTYPGLNWTTAGQAFWNNGCNQPTATPTTAPPTVTPTTAPPTVTPTTAPPTVAPTTAPPTVAPTTAPPTVTPTTAPPTVTPTTAPPTVTPTTAPPVVVPTTAPPVDGEPTPVPSPSDFTGGGGTPEVPPAEPVDAPEQPTFTGGGGTPTTAEELPLTGDRTGMLAAWASLAVAAGLGLLGAGTRRATR